jgi:hypothetical protein
MDTKYIVAFVLLAGSAFGSILLACLSQRFRDLLFFLLVTCTAITESLDVNFVSREWYRGTTCGFEISLVDIFSISLLISSILVPRRGERRWLWPASLLLMIVYFWFSAFCVAIADPKLFGLFALSKLVRGIFIFLAAASYVRSEREVKLFVLALGAAVCYEVFLGLEQRYRFGIHRVFGSLNAANSLSMYLCLTAPVFVAALNSRLPKYLKALSVMTIGLAAIGVVLTISRAGVVTFGLVLLAATLATVSFKLTGRKVAITVLVTLAATGILAKSWKSLSSRFGEATLEQEYENRNAQGRGYYLRMAAAIVDEHWFGVGPNNWSYWVSNKYGPRLGFRFAPYPGPDRPPKFKVEYGANVDDPQAAPAHSLAALTVGEMGFGGLILLALLWLRWFQMGASFLWKRVADPTRRIPIGIFFGTWGIFLQSITEWVFHQTAIYFTFHIMLGVLASMYFLKKEERRAERLAQETEFESPWQEEPLPTVVVEDAHYSPAEKI